MVEPAIIPPSLLNHLWKNGEKRPVKRKVNKQSKKKCEVIPSDEPPSASVTALAEEVMTKILPKLSISLYRDHPAMDLQAKKDLIWEIVGKKLTPQTDQCLVCTNTTHSVANHSCVYANETELVKTCFSGKSEVVRGTEPKRLLEYLNKTVFDINVKDETTTAVQILQEDVWDNAREEKLRREKGTGRVFKRVEKDGKAVPYAYVYWKSGSDYLNDLLYQHPKFHSSNSNLKSLETILSDFKHKDFPWLEVDDDRLGFNNGILDKKTMDFMLLSDCNDDIPQCRTYFDVDYPLTEEYSVPTLDRLLDFQFSPEVKDLLLMSLGRTFFLTNEVDNFRYMVFLHGPPGCGKSQIIELLQYLHGGKEYIGNIEEGFQKEFGASALIGKRIILVEELPENIKDVFPQTTFQKGVDGSFISSTAKGKDQVTEDFRVPMVFAGNWHFNYLDRGQVSRRVVTYTYENYVPDDMKDTGIQKKLRSEIGCIIRRCLELYHYYVGKYEGRSIWTFAPKECIEAKEEGLSFSNPLFRFLKDRSKVTVDINSQVLLKDVKIAFEKYVDKKITKMLDRGIIEQAGFKLRKDKICKSCRQLANVKDCCSDRSHDNRTTAPEVVLGIKLL